MKVLETVFTLSPGGIERFVVDLSNELSKTNDITLLVLKDDKKDTNIRNFYKNEICDRVRYDNLALKDGKRISSLWKVLNYIKSNKVDIVHINGHAAPYFFILAILKCRHTIFVQTIHSDISKYRDLAYCFLASSFAYFLNYHFVALSQKNYSDLIRVYPHAKSHLIFNGRSAMVCTPQYEFVKRNILALKRNNSTLTFIHIARFHEAKNQQLLISAFNHILKEGFNVNLLVIGEGYDTVDGEKLKSIASSDIHFLGSQHNVSDYLYSSNIFCLSSIYEGLPITIIEAQLCGLPVVSTPVCGAVDIIENGKNGIISKDFTLEKYIEALKESINNYNNLQFNAKKASIASPYTIENCAKRYDELYQSLSYKSSSNK